MKRPFILTLSSFKESIPIGLEGDTETMEAHFEKRFGSSLMKILYEMKGFPSYHSKKDVPIDTFDTPLLGDSQPTESIHTLFPSSFFQQLEQHPSISCNIMISETESHPVSSNQAASTTSTITEEVSNKNPKINQFIRRLPLQSNYDNLIIVENLYSTADLDSRTFILQIDSCVVEMQVHESFCNMTSFLKRSVELSDDMFMEHDRPVLSIHLPVTPNNFGIHIGTSGELYPHQMSAWVDMDHVRKTIQSLNFVHHQIAPYNGQMKRIDDESMIRFKGNFERQLRYCEMADAAITVIGILAFVVYVVASYYIVTRSEARKFHAKPSLSSSPSCPRTRPMGRSSLWYRDLIKSYRSKVSRSAAIFTSKVYVFGSMCNRYYLNSIRTLQTIVAITLQSLQSHRISISLYVVKFLSGAYHLIKSYRSKVSRSATLLTSKVYVFGSMCNRYYLKSMRTLQTIVAIMLQSSNQNLPPVRIRENGTCLETLKQIIDFMKVFNHLFQRFKTQSIFSDCYRRMILIIYYVDTHFLTIFHRTNDSSRPHLATNDDQSFNWRSLCCYDYEAVENAYEILPITLWSQYMDDYENHGRSSNKKDNEDASFSIVAKSTLSEYDSPLMDPQSFLTNAEEHYPLNWISYDEMKNESIECCHNGNDLYLDANREVSILCEKNRTMIIERNSTLSLSPSGKWRRKNLDDPSSFDSDQNFDEKRNCLSPCSRLENMWKAKLLHKSTEGGCLKKRTRVMEPPTISSENAYP